MATFFCVTGGVLISIPSLASYTRWCALIGKMGINAIYSTVFLIGAELFPTPVRYAQVGFQILISFQIESNFIWYGNLYHWWIHISPDNRNTSCYPLAALWFIWIGSVFRIFEFFLHSRIRFVPITTTGFCHHHLIQVSQSDHQVS